MSIHSEGKRYAHNRTEAGFSLITEASALECVIAERLEEWVGVIRVLAAEKDLQLPESTDLFLEIDDNSGTCSYWFADHAHRTVFWLHPADTDTVGLPKAYSNAHLRKFCLAVYVVKKNFLKIAKNTPWRRIIGLMSRCFPRRHPSIL